MLLSPRSYGQITAGFTASSAQGCPPVNVSFIDNSVGVVTTYLWDFGNGNTSTSTNPSAIYITPGKYTVSLTVRGPSGSSTETKTSFITIFKPPTAQASTSKRTGCIGDVIGFNDISTKGDGDIVGWKWDFGDGNISTSQNPSHSYNTSGTYSIRLIVTDANGCDHNTTLNNHITINPNPDPTFTISDPFGCKSPHSTSFTAQASGTGLKYSWNYGDGNGGQGKNPNTSYQANGSYTVTLEVTDNLGCKSQSSDKVIIADLVPKIFASKTIACIDEYLNFVASVYPNMPNVKYEWDMGDGRTVSGHAFSHNYKADGLYTVTLKATSPGCSGTTIKTDLIQVRKKPKKDITISDTIICDRSKPIKFTDNNTTDIVKRLWTFSNGEKSSQASKSVLFKNGGDYNYTLEIEDRFGCANKITGNVKVSEIKADFITDKFTKDSFYSNALKRNRPVYGECTPYLLELKQDIASFYKVAKFSWDLSDGKRIQSEPKVSFTYKEVDSIKHGWLWAQDIYGCKDSIDYYIELGDSTYPNFIPDKWTFCNGDTVNFRNTSTDSTKITEVIWDFGKKDYHTFNVYNMRPDSFSIGLKTFHHNCVNDTTIGGFKIIGPFIEIKTSYNPCSTDSIELEAFGYEYDSLVWLDESLNVLSHDTFFKVPAISGKKYYLKALSDIDCDQIDSVVIKLTGLIVLDVNWPAITECAPTPATFSLNNSGLHGPKWIFSDGDTVLGFTANHLFKKAGDYTVKLMVSGGGKCNASVTKPYFIPGVIVKGNIIAKDSCLPFNIELFDSTYSPTRKENFFWVINETDTLYHTAFKTDYLAKSQNKDGKIFIELVGNDSFSCSSSIPFETKAGGPYTTIFNYNSFLCDSLYAEINLLNRSKDIVSISWKIDGKEVGYQPILNYYFPYDKKNKVTVTLGDSYGCKSTFTKEIFAPKNLKADFSSDTTGSFCPPLEVYFKNHSVSKNPIAKYEWDFGDGTNSYLPNPGKLYLVPGKFTVSLKITDDKGCSSTKIAPDFILVNGPIGTYSFSPNEGCTPLTVDFISESTNASVIKWDLGDGKVLNGPTQKLTYDRIGQYIPLLILEDIYGCSYTMPPIDTINVRGFPKANFTNKNACYGEEVTFTNETDTSKGAIKSYLWDFGDGKTSDSIMPKHVFEKGKSFNIRLIARNKFNCMDTIQKIVKVYDPRALFTLSKKQYCLGEDIGITNNSISDTTIKRYSWTLTNQDSSSSKEPAYTANLVGNLDLKLIITDNAGCTDTLAQPAAIAVGDTVAPLPPSIYRASVLNDNAIDITFKTDSIVDFLKYELYRETGPNSFTKISEVLNQSDSIIYDNNIQTLHKSHCFVVNKENFCKVKTDLDKLIKHCTVEATATGGLNKIDLDWNPYMGWNEVDSYYVYREERHIPDSFTQIGKVDGNTLIYTDSTIYCREEMFYKILAKQKTNSLVQYSWSDTTAAKPLYQNTIAPNEIWRTTVVDDEYTNLEWLPITHSKFPIAYYKIQVKEGDKEYKELKDKFTPTTTSFDYLKTKVDDYNYHFQMYAVDVCEDKSELSVPAKTVLLDVTMSEAFRPSLSWSTYQGWAEGVEEYVIEMEDEYGSFLEIGRNNPQDTFFVDQVSPFNDIEKYCYRITAIRNQPTNYPDSTHTVISHSNVDCAPVESKLFVPNAFTINSDNLNEDFTVKGIYIKEYNIKIFNRWGEKVFDSNSFKTHWDGTYNGENVSQGVFVYIISARGVDNKIYHLNGDVTLLR